MDKMEHEIHCEQQSARYWESLPEQFCMICLATSEEYKLYPANMFNLDVEFKQLTGISLQDDMQFAPQFCSECAQRLSNSRKFREKSLRAYHLLLGLFEKHKTLTMQIIKTVDRKDKKLASNIAKKLYQPNHCDMYLIEMKRNQDLTVYQTQENNVNTDETKVFQNKPQDTVTELEIKDEVEDLLPNNDATDIFKNEIVNEPTVKSNRNDLESRDYDIDIDVSDDNINDCDTDLAKDQHVKKENLDTKSGTVKNDARKKTATRKVNALKRKKAIKSEKPIRVRKRPVKKILTNDVKDVVVRKRKTTKKPPVNKLDLKSVEEVKLTVEEQKAEIEKRKNLDNYTNSWYKCDFCYKGFHRLEPYNAHMERHTDKFGLFECEVCHTRYRSERLKRKHFNYNHCYMYKCTECPYVTTHRNSAVLHQRWHDGKVYKCIHCDMKFSKCSTLKSHERIKHPSDFVCSQCGFSFIGEKGLRSHMDKKHPFDDTENLAGPLCEPCNIRFASEDAYMQHMFASPKHASAELLRPNCPLQNRTTTTNQKPIDCEQCGMRLLGVRRYEMHFRAKHPDKTRSQFPKGSPKQPRDKSRAVMKSRPKAVCEKCGKVYPTSRRLIQHMQMHTGEKLYKCTICDKGFTTNMSLRIHEMRHSGKNSFQCDVCLKVLSNPANQRRHMLLHEDSRPLYECSHCGKSFTSAAGRDLHVSHVHFHVPRPKRNRRVRRDRADAGHSADTSDSRD
ncbi:zinc finger protein 879-like [Maniola jurtina]|uniref:zinc finger protein 879-like n=1 Tax=Maniola jurtina TaxID=191418 RepID=UPI001E68FB70|nr:zinc finger protein 879-like [Maniola jurtina]XP_045783164.1 zinc finger protein 879-like [Maniola jurtina]